MITLPMKTIVVNFMLPKTAEEARRCVDERNREAREARAREAREHAERFQKIVEMEGKARKGAGSPPRATRSAAPPRPGVPSKVYAARNRPRRIESARERYDASLRHNGQPPRGGVA